MRNNFVIIIFSAFVFIFSGCLKGSNPAPCTNKTPQSEAAAIQAYATAKGYNMSAHSSGLYYQIVDPGAGAVPLPSSKVFVTYIGRLISSDAVFDQQNNSTLTGWVLETLIPGWQFGLPLIAEGGTIRLIVPSALAYGCNGRAVIPGDAVLFFEIELVDVQ
jgi:FKBP-type peptidyl-prolyl cis-trans isomerase